MIGEYTVKEPDGNIRIVKYRADEDGFHATVHNSHRRNEHEHEPEPEHEREHEPENDSGDGSYDEEEQ